MECVVLTGSDAADLQIVITNWLSAAEFDMTIKHIAMSEGTIGAAALKAVILYERATHSVHS
jgi:type IV secretory pathway TrbD component